MPCVRLAAVLLVLALSSVPLRAADGIVRGEVTDTSGAVLPGVTVTAFADGREVATTITDGIGRYAFAALPAGKVRITFHLDGFDSVTVDVDVLPDAETRVVERLSLAQFTEQVEVVAEAPEPPKPYVPTPRPPKYAVVPLPLAELETICLPTKAGGQAAVATVQAHLQEPGRTLYGRGDEVIIDAGTADGIEIGRNLVVRRNYRAENRGAVGERGEQTTGLVQVSAAGEHKSTAVVVHTCSEVMQGDFLASYTPEIKRTPEPFGLPAFGDPIRILFADANQMLGAPRRLMVIDRGSAYGLQPGQRLTLFRDDPKHIAPPYVIGEAVIIAVKSWSSTIRIEHATDAIWDGDWAAPQLASPLAGPGSQ
jgi:hypothetical protein